MKIKLTPKMLVAILYIAITLSCALSLVGINTANGHQWGWGLPAIIAMITGIPAVLFYFAGKEAGRNEILKKEEK